MFYFLCGLSAFLITLLLAALIILWRQTDPTLHGRARVLRVCHRLIFLFGLCIGCLRDRVAGRSKAFNAALLPTETSRGTQSMLADAGVTTTFFNAVVKIGSDDRHFALVAAATDIPLGILFNDQVDAGEANTIPKQVAVFGLYAESLPGVAAAAIAASVEVVADLTTPGRVKTLPTASGTYVVFGRARQAASAAGEPVSIIHCVPRVVVVP